MIIWHYLTFGPTGPDILRATFAWCVVALVFGLIVTLIAIYVTTPERR